MKNPGGAKYRNLFAAGNCVWYDRTAGGRRYRVNTGASTATLEGWKEAASFRDQYESAKKIGAPRTYTGAMPTFAEMADKYTENDTKHLALTTRNDRRLHLAADGVILRHLGPKRLDDVSAATLREWWDIEIQSTERTPETGKRYLASIAGVFNYAVDKGYLTESPVDLFRRSLARRERSKQGRAAEGSKANPIEDREALARLVAEAKAEGPVEYVMVLAMLDAGLRRGEAFALRWRSVAWGTCADDPRRHLFVSATRSRDGDADDAPKSGRFRRVQLSRRLRGALEELFTERRPKSLDDRLCGELDGPDFLRGPWQSIIARADLPGRVPKDLRDTFASWLVSCSIPMLYVSRQLGHSTSQVTEWHYAKWIPGGGDLYVPPPSLASGDVPADLLTRLPESPTASNVGDPYALPDSLKSLDLQ